jgi:hypothetical protein
MLSINALFGSSSYIYKLLYILWGIPYINEEAYLKKTKIKKTTRDTPFVFVFPKYERLTKPLFTPFENSVKLF